MATLVFTDKEYIEGLRHGNDAVIRSVYNKFYPVISRMVLNNSGTEPEARDIFQETVLVLYHHVQQPAFSLSCALQTYLYSVARRLWLKQLHKKHGLFKLDERFREEEDVADPGADLDTYEQREANLSRMKESIDQLGEPCKTLLEDFYTRHLSMDEIAEKFGYTNADNAKTQKYKCLQRLKKIFFIDKEGSTT